MKLYYEACASWQLMPADTTGAPVTIEGTIVTPYEFRPHLGVVKLIDPNGETISYGYDAFARLISVTDHYGIMERAFNYHYKRNSEMRKMLILFLWFVSALSLYGQSAEYCVLATVYTTKGGYMSLDFIRPFLAMPKLKPASLWSFGLTKTFAKSGSGIHATYTPTYHFYMKDHLGSNRVVASAAGVAEQVNHYYPYGSTFYGEKSR